MSHRREPPFSRPTGIAIGVEGRRVRVELGEFVDRLEFDPKDARRVGELLIRHAARIDGLPEELGIGG